MKDWAKFIGGLLFAIAIINFALFAVVSISIGGDALNGKEENGKFYVSNHGELTEVSESVWRFSRAHAISVICTHVVGIAVGGALMKYGDSPDTG